MLWILRDLLSPYHFFPLFSSWLRSWWSRSRRCVAQGIIHTWSDFSLFFVRIRCLFPKLLLSPLHQNRLVIFYLGSSVIFVVGKYLLHVSWWVVIKNDPEAVFLGDLDAIVLALVLKFGNFIPFLGTGLPFVELTHWVELDYFWFSGQEFWWDVFAAVKVGKDGFTFLFRIFQLLKHAFLLDVIWIVRYFFRDQFLGKGFWPRKDTHSDLFSWLLRNKGWIKFFQLFFPSKWQTNLYLVLR